MKYLDDPHYGREDGEVARNRGAAKEDRLVPRLLLCLRDGSLYGHRLEERLGELGFEGMPPGEMYRLLWQLEQEGMVLCNREGGGFSVPQRCYALTEVGEAYLESYTGSLAHYGEEKDPVSLLQDERLGEGQRVKGEQRSAEQKPRKSSGPSYWLIAKNENGRIEVSTVRLHGGEEALAVFGYEEEAELFLWFEVSSHGWRIRESSAGDLVSVLYGLSKGVEKVVLDPLPRLLAEKTVGFVSMERERFVDFVTIGKKQLHPAIRADQTPQVGAGSLRSRATPEYLRKAISTAQRGRC